MPLYINDVAEHFKVQKHGVGFANILKSVIFLNRGIKLLQLILTKKKDSTKVLQLIKNEAIFEKNSPKETREIHG